MLKARVLWHVVGNWLCCLARLIERNLAAMKCERVEAKWRAVTEIVVLCDA